MEGIRAALWAYSDQRESTQSNQVLPSLCVWSATAGVKQSKLGESVSCLLSVVKLVCTPINFCLGISGFVFFLLIQQHFGTEQLC